MFDQTQDIRHESQVSTYASSQLAISPPRINTANIPISWNDTGLSFLFIFNDPSYLKAILFACTSSLGSPGVCTISLGSPGVWGLYSFAYVDSDCFWWNLEWHEVLGCTYTLHVLPPLSSLSWIVDSSSGLFRVRWQWGISLSRVSLGLIGL